MNLKICNLDLSLQGRQILHDIDFAVTAKQTVGLLGPNGSGKSTLIRCLAGLMPSARRSVMLDEQPLYSIPHRELARRVAFVPQHSETELAMSVMEIVRMGRTPHRGRFSLWSETDEQAVDQAIQMTDLNALLKRQWQHLSGGERQRCQIARALAQTPDVLLLDEPTNHLDIHHQLELMNLIKALPVTVIVALHDLNLAANYCDKLVILRKGLIKSSGEPLQALTPGLIRSVWKVDATVTCKTDINIQFSGPRNIAGKGQLQTQHSCAA